MKALSVKVNVEQGDWSVPFSPSLWASLVHPQQRTRPQGDGRGERTKGSGGWGFTSQSAASRGAGGVPGTQGGHTQRDYSKWDRGWVGGEASFLCGPRPVPNQVEAGRAGGQAWYRRETQALLGSCGQGEPRFLSSWTKASMISSFIFCSSFLTSSRSSCFTLSNSDSSPELCVEGCASDVVTDEEAFILGKVVLFFSQGLRTDSLWTGTRVSGSS